MSYQKSEYYDQEYADYTNEQDDDFYRNDEYEGDVSHYETYTDIDDHQNEEFQPFEYDDPDPISAEFADDPREWIFEDEDYYEVEHLTAQDEMDFDHRLEDSNNFYEQEQEYDHFYEEERYNNFYEEEDSSYQAEQDEELTGWDEDSYWDDLDSMDQEQSNFPAFSTQDDVELLHHQQELYSQQQAMRIEGYYRSQEHQRFQEHHYLQQQEYARSHSRRLVNKHEVKGKMGRRGDMITSLRRLNMVYGIICLLLLCIDII